VRCGAATTNISVLRDNWYGWKRAGLLAVGIPICDLPSDGRRRNRMLWTVAVVLIVLWLLGLVSSYTLGGFIHVLLVIAIVVILVQVIQGRRL
jgi:Family of unknown function (DUF5670)